MTGALAALNGFTLRQADFGGARLLSSPHLSLRQRSFRPSGDVTDNRLTEPCALLFSPKLSPGLLPARHRAVDDHAPGEPDGGLRVDVLSDDVRNVRQAMAAAVLHAPRLALGTPLNLAPQLPVDCQPVNSRTLGANLDHTVASLVGHDLLLFGWFHSDRFPFTHLFRPSRGIPFSNCHKCHKPNSHAGFCCFSKMSQRGVCDTLENGMLPHSHRRL